MTDIFSKKKRSEIMSKIKGRDTGLERDFASILKKKTKIRFSLNDGTILGKPDVVFRGQRVCIFIDGDFWHGWRYPAWKRKLSKKWREKIERNRKRDKSVVRNLRRHGWMVFRVWEHDLRSEDRISDVLLKIQLSLI